MLFLTDETDGDSKNQAYLIGLFFTSGINAWLLLPWSLSSLEEKRQVGLN